MRLVIKERSYMTESKRYVVLVKQKNDGETKVSMRPIKKKLCSCCFSDIIINALPYIVIFILGGCALSKIDGCSSLVNERTVSRTNEVLRVEFKCIHCGCKK